MAVTYEPVNPSPVANTTLVKGLLNGIHKNCRISPIEGYVLHDNVRDWTEADPITGEEILKLGYTTGTASCKADYDFTANPRAFYAVPQGDVPADQIF